MSLFFTLKIVHILVSIVNFELVLVGYGMFQKYSLLLQVIIKVPQIIKIDITFCHISPYINLFYFKGIKM